MSKHIKIGVHFFFFLLGSAAFAQDSVNSPVPIWTNRAGETLAARPLALTNQTVYLALSSGRNARIPLRVFPESEQQRMQFMLGMAAIPNCLVPAWRLFENQLATAPDVESVRTALGFMVKQIKKHAEAQVLESKESAYWIARATEKERVARRALLEKRQQAGNSETISAVQQRGKE